MPLGPSAGASPARGPAPVGDAAVPAAAGRGGSDHPTDRSGRAVQVLCTSVHHVVHSCGAACRRRPHPCGWRLL